VTEDRKSLRDLTLTLLAARAPGATICPSEVARASVADTGGSRAGTETWREAMPEVHAAIDRLLAERLVQLSWKGKLLAARDGPYRIRARSTG
jgi:hypothetical protein